MNSQLALLRGRVNSDVVRLSLLMKSILLVTAVFVIALTPSQPTLACSCGMPTVNEAFEKSKLVFAGTIIAIESDGVTFKVTQSWKGATSNVIKVYVRDLGTSCDPGVAKNRTLLVYAYPGGRRIPLLAAYCRRTRVLTKPDDETAELDALRTSAHVRRTTTRWTGAAEACFVTSKMRRRLNEFAPPGQL